jgi:hypothetical protein
MEDIERISSAASIDSTIFALASVKGLSAVHELSKRGEAA